MADKICSQELKKDRQFPRSSGFFVFTNLAYDLYLTCILLSNEEVIHGILTAKEQTSERTKERANERTKERESERKNKQTSL
ncbi:uncharacterized protein LOC144116486 [Amblyomma americanum]